MRMPITGPIRALGLLGALIIIISACGTPQASTRTTAPSPSGASASAGESPEESAGESPEESAGESPGGGGVVDLTGVELTVGSKEFTEQLILGQITIQVLEDAGATVNDETGTQGSDVTRAALLAGDTDMYWEYTGTGWINHLGNTDPVPGAEEQYIAVRDADAANGIVWLEPAPLNNSYTIALASETATELELTTLSDLAALAAESPDQTTLCAATEFQARVSDGMPGVEAAYGFEFSDVATLELGIIPDAIDSAEDCIFGEVFATDTRITSLGLTVLEDDLAFFPSYEPSLNVRQEVFDANPGLADLFAPVAAVLDTETMLALNGTVDIDGENEADVAAAFLQEQGLIGE